jgi:excisionase family DNA binding protein
MDSNELMNLGQAVLILINCLVSELKEVGLTNQGNHNITPLVYTPEELAKKLGISSDLVYKRLIYQPGFPIRRVGKRILIPAERFHHWINDIK